MTARIKNGIGLRKEMEARKPAIGLNASGSYVLRSFDPDEYAHVIKVDFDRIAFEEIESVVIAQGTLGSLARLAKLSPDRRYARYFGSKFVSVALIHGEVFSKHDFILSVAKNPTLRVSHVQTGKVYVGVLHGDITKSYKTLVYPAGDRINFLDLEENPPPQASRMQVRILETDPPEGAQVRSELVNRFVKKTSV
jgi:hypothetical protein